MLLDAARHHSFPFRAALWLAPLSAILHNLEEYPRILDYAARHYPIALPPPEQMNTAIVLADVAPMVATALTMGAPKGGWRLQVALAYQAALAANALSHIGQTLYFRDYSPGTLSALALVLPVSIYLYRRAADEAYLSREQLMVAAGAGTVMMPIGIVLLQSAGAALSGNG